MEGNIKARFQAAAQQAAADSHDLDDDILDLARAIKIRYTRGTIDNSKAVLELIDLWIERTERG